MKVLFCTDDSEISLYALYKALGVLKKDFIIDIVTVLETGFLTTFVTFPYETEIGFPEYANAAEKLLEDTAGIIESKDFKAGEKIQTEGYPSDRILDLIYGGNYSAVILGSHGKKGIKKWLGSVSSKISQKSPIPVLIVKPSTNNKKDEKEILITVDGSQKSYDSIKKASEIINFQNSSVEILSVKTGIKDFPSEIRNDAAWLKSCLEKRDIIADDVLEKAEITLKENNIALSKKTVLEGDPAEEILKYTEKNPKDLVIMGSHRREGLSSLLLGSVSKILLDNVNASVFIIHNKSD